jgi:FKBP-type peptidyl-prolyl cis-trans isomerase SlyD
MQVAKDKVVGIDYKLTNPQGDVLDSSADHGRPLEYVHGSGHLIPGLEKALEGHVSGDQINVTIAPEDAYGQKDPAMVQPVPRAVLANIPNLKVGMQLQAQSPNGMRVVTVVAMDDENVTIDGNHPLAGVALTFDVKVAGVREATAEELAHGRVGAAGCDCGEDCDCEGDGKGCDCDGDGKGCDCDCGKDH